MSTKKARSLSSGALIKLKMACNSNKQLLFLQLSFPSCHGGLRKKTDFPERKRFYRVVLHSSTRFHGYPWCACLSTFSAYLRTGDQA